MCLPEMQFYSTINKVIAAVWCPEFHLTIKFAHQHYFYNITVRLIVHVMQQAAYFRQTTTSTWDECFGKSLLYFTFTNSTNNLMKLWVFWSLRGEKCGKPRDIFNGNGSTPIKFCVNSGLSKEVHSISLWDSYSFS